MQPFRKGHQFTSKQMRRRIERKQRQAQRVFLAGKGKTRRKKKPVEWATPTIARTPYPCGPKQMTLGEAFA